MFDEQMKLQAFDLIAQKFFEHNFGRTSKADLEVLMFKIYLDNCNAQNTATDDFTLATALGITEAKVRNLKVKKELQYPGDGKEWKENFIRAIQYASYDEKSSLVKLPIADPNVKRNLEHRIDELHIYSESQLNGKLLQMRPDHFIMLVQTISEELGNAAIDSKSLLHQLEASSTAEIFKAEGIIDRIKGGAEVKELIPMILKTAGKTGVQVLLSSIPFSGGLKKYMDAFADNL